MAESRLHRSGQEEEVDELTHILHELRVHQIELEIQNEELRAAQQIGEERMEQFVSLFEDAPVPFLTMNPSGIVLRANRRALQLLDVSRSRLTGNPFILFLADTSRAPFFQRLDLLTPDEPACSIQLVCRGAKRKAVPVFARISRVEIGEEVTFRLALIDLSERAELADSVREAQQETMHEAGTRGDFLNHLLNVIERGLADAPKLADLDPDESGLARDAVLANLRLRRRIGALIRLTGVETHLPSVSKRLNLEVEVRQAINLLSVPQDVTVSVEAGQGRILAHANPEALREVLDHVLDNAMRYAGGRVWITIEMDELRSAIHITDTGPGIPEKALAQAREPLNFSTMPASGIGLQVAHHLMREMRGSIDLASETGGGTTVSLYLPRRSPSQSTPVRTSKETGRQARLLLVEDDPHTQRYVGFVFREQYQVDTRSDAHSGLRMLKEKAYDAVLFDINLGEGATGVELLHLMRETELNAKTPAIALTAYALPEERKRILNAGFDLHVSKPFNRSVLQQAVLQLI
ncbi:MAG: ATP-binding protein [Bacteroidota bacterium]